MAKRFSKKQLGYIHWRARGENLTDSVIKGGFKARSRKNANRIGIELESKTQILEAIEKERTQIFDTSMITDEYILTGLKDIAQNGKVEANKVRAWELLGKALPGGLFTDKQEIKVNTFDTELTQRRNRVLSN